MSAMAPARGVFAPPPPAAGVRACHVFARGCTQCYLAQVLLGGCATLPLVYKWRAEPRARRRTAAQFVVDCSKQGLGNVTCHLANMAFALWVGDPRPAAGAQCADASCVWYLVMLAIDCSVGVLLSFVLLAGLRAAADRVRWLPALRRYGFYGEPFSVARFAAQLLAWEFIVLLGKTLLGLLIWPTRQYLLAAGTFLLTPVRCARAINGFDVELYTVMLFIPVLLNGASFWCTDAFIKEQLPEDGDEAQQLRAEEGGAKVRTRRESARMDTRAAAACPRTRIGADVSRRCPCRCWGESVRAKG